MKGTTKIAVIGALGSVFSLGNSWFKTKETTERMAKEAAKMKEKELLLEKKVELVSKSLNKQGKVELEKLNTQINDLDNQLNTLRNTVPENSLLDHLDLYTQKLLSNYIDLFKNNFTLGQEFWSGLNATLKSFVLALLPLLLVAIIWWFSKSRANKVLPSANFSSDKAQSHFTVNIYNSGEKEKPSKVENTRIE